MTQITYRICVNQLHAISRFLINNRLLVVKFGRSQSYTQTSSVQGVSTATCHIVQKSTVCVLSGLWAFYLFFLYFLYLLDVCNRRALLI